jgi:hypothetical protein
LTSIEFPSSVQVIESSAFRGLELSSVVLSEGHSPYRVHQSFLQDISRRSIYRYFGNCRSVVIPSFVTVLGKASFAWCKSLTTIEFENHSQLRQIGELAFSETGLTTICLPSSLTEVHNTAFFKNKSQITVIFQRGSNHELIKKFQRDSPRHILKHHHRSGFAESQIQIQMRNDSNQRIVDILVMRYRLGVIDELIEALI